MSETHQKPAKQLDPAIVALIAAILDPDEVRRTEPTNEIPNCLPAALDLVSKAQRLIDGTVAPEDLSTEWRERLRQTGVIDEIATRAEWKLNGPEQYTLTQVVRSDWCRGFKSEHKLKAFLKRLQFPFETFGRKEISITRAAFEYALELESKTPEGKERARKRENCSEV